MELLLRIERHLRATRTPPTRFGMLAAKDPRLVFDLRRGRTAGERVRRKVEAYLASTAP